MPKTLQIGNDLLLMQSRMGLLAASGLDVLNLVGLAETLDRIPSIHWDLAILCHTLSRSECGKIMAALRRHNPHARVLFIARRSDTPAAGGNGFDMVLSPVPAKMISALREIAKQLARKQPQAEFEEAAN